MPTRLLHESFCVSDSIATCSPKAQDAFPRFLLLADNFGVFKVILEALRGRGWPRRPEVRLRDIAGWLIEYVDADMVQLYTCKGQLYAYFLGWSKHQRVRPELKRQHPLQPDYVKETSVRLCGDLLQVAALRGKVRISSSGSCSGSSVAVAGAIAVAVPCGEPPRDGYPQAPSADSPEASSSGATHKSPTPEQIASDRILHKEYSRAKHT